MKSILLLTDWFAPGFKAGGPIRSCVNFAQAMKQQYHIRVLTGDRDLGDTEPYPDVPQDEWVEQEEGIQVQYLSPEKTNYANLLRVVREVAPDYIYLNSMFSVPFTLYPLWMLQRRKLNAQVVLAPRGMLQEGALQYKPVKKKVFLNLLHRLRLEKKIVFQATDEQEAADIRRFFGRAKKVVVASNFPVSKQKEWRQIDKKEGKVRIAHISRISPKKNLAFLIDCLQYVTAETELLIAGPIDDQKYWDLCQKKAENLPNNILFRYIGEVNYPEVATILQKSHLFCLLTFGENFGHAIFEAFINGRPVLISDKTPWRQLTDRKAGWDLSLDNRAGISNQLEAIASMTQEAYDPWSKGAWTYAQQFLQQTDLLEQYAALFP